MACLISLGLAFWQKIPWEGEFTFNVAFTPTMLKMSWKSVGTSVGCLVNDKETIAGAV